ncbi:MAG: IclR family transcriptional regulator [Devosia sp.]|nr:IclR family transcriptional regulator [Devosia sp.]
MLQLLDHAIGDAKDKGQNVKSLFKMLDVLDCFSDIDPELSVLQIAQRTGLPRTTVHRLVDSLRAVGFLEQEASRESYRLGLKLFGLGNTALTNMPLHRKAAPFVEALAKLSGETVHLCVFEGSQMVFVERSLDRARPNNMVTTMEATPCHSTGVGKAALAFQPPAVIDRIIGLGLQRFTRNTIIAPETLREELAAIRARGYAIDDCEHEPDLRCVAAPIRNVTGRVFAAVSVSGNIRRMEQHRVEDLAALVTSHARQISAQLGYLPGAPARKRRP